jgi:hypothetical protein
LGYSRQGETVEKDMERAAVELQGDNGQLLVIERSSFGPSGTPADEDLLLNVSVKVGAYSAADQVWVLASNWRVFMAELRELERLRQGHASLEGPGPRDMKLIFQATDSWGHTAVSGFLGWDAPDGFAQRLEFGFPFDAGMLATLVQQFEALGR